jgi:hypothetical protein
MLDGLFHQIAVEHTVCLDALGMYGRALACVEHTVLKHNFICGSAHFAAERVDLKDELALARAADGRIAGQVGDGVVGNGEKNGFNAHSCGGKRGFATGVSCADDGNVCRIYVKFHRVFVEGLFEKSFPQTPFKNFCVGVAVRLLVVIAA